MKTQPDATQILRDASAGDEAAIERLLALVYTDLRALAQRYLSHERIGHTLQATALVHEAYMRLVRQDNVDWQGRTHFFAVSAQAVRRVLVDHARGRSRAKRGGGRRDRLTVTSAADFSQEPAETIDLLALHEALEELRAMSERQARVVELRFFGGLTVEEAALVLSVSPRTVKGDWRVAKAWLRQRLEMMEGEDQ